MARTLSFDTGVVEYEINGAATVRFNPTDSDFVDRLYQTFTDLDARQDEFRAHVAEIEGDGDALFAYARDRDHEMRGSIDALLGEGVADALFPDMNCYDMADGLPVWINLMLAIAEEIERAYATEQKRSDPRLRSYNKKYETMLKKYKGQW